jgi:hypothetical protein
MHGLEPPGGDDQEVWRAGTEEIVQVRRREDQTDIFLISQDRSLVHHYHDPLFYPLGRVP